MLHGQREKTAQNETLEKCFGEDKQRQYQRHQGRQRRMQLSWSS